MRKIFSIKIYADKMMSDYSRRWADVVDVTSPWQRLVSSAADAAE